MGWTRGVIGRRQLAETRKHVYRLRGITGWELLVVGRRQLAETRQRVDKATRRSTVRE